MTTLVVRRLEFGSHDVAEALEVVKVMETPPGGAGSSMETVTVFLTGLNDLRLRIPISQAMGITTIALPLAGFAREGILHGAVVQTGETLSEAATSPNPKRIAPEQPIFAGLDRTGNHYRAHDDDGCLLIPVDPANDEVALYTVALTSLSHDRILAARRGDSEGAPWATLSWRGPDHSATARQA